MLSILIPIYNFDVRELVQELHTQCMKAQVYFEIVCFDDGSKTSFREKNRPIGGLVNVSYIELSENKGRALIRNLLGKNARYDHLLFLDCDSKIISKKFIKNYLKEIENHQVISGGRIYTKTKPKAQSKILHWTYGIKRESSNIKRRIKHPYLLFHTNNFLINRDFFLDIQFDNQLKQYGYEDLLFAQKIKKAGQKIYHTQNPVKHGALEKTDDFLKKIDLSIKNLVTLHQNKHQLETPITKAYHRLERNKLLSVYLWLYKRFKKRVEHSLRSHNPRMFYLDLQKLAQYIEVSNAYKNQNSE